MGWEQRGSNCYYIRRYSIQGRKVRHSLGRGLAAMQAAAIDAERRAINADFRGRKLTHTGLESRVLESDREIVQPWNRRAFLIQGGFAQERMVRPLVEAYDEAVSVHCEQATGFHKLAIELFGLRFVEPMQLSGHPPRAAVGQDRQGDIHVHL